MGRIEEQPSASEESGDDLEDEIPGAYVLIARALNTACQTNTFTFSAVQRVVAKRIFACFFSTYEMKCCSGDMEFLSNSNQGSDDEFPMDGFLIEGQGLRQNVRDPMDLGLFAVDVVDRGPNDDDGSSTGVVRAELYIG